MSSSSISFSFFMFLNLVLTFSAEGVEWEDMTARRQLGDEASCRTGNPIDDCWRCDPNWESNRKMLADCAVGFGRNAVGGRDGEIYVVTDSGNDDPQNPNPGTLRYAALQEEPLWIIFDHDMAISLKEELVINSYKTIDGRGFNIQIANGPCLAIYNVRTNQTTTDYGGDPDGDGISITGSRDVWIDHCTLANCNDGLIDAVYGSTAITISNNYMFHHNEVMLMGHSDDFVDDKNMQVTIAFNVFGEGLVQRMPRCRHGYFHIVNNIYSGWEMYAIGGSASPTINSQGNVTKHESEDEEEWKKWNWRSDGDLMLNGAFFTPSGEESPASYMKASSMVARPASFLTKYSPSAGAMNCQKGHHC
ncbi:hypothetical protein Patl1_03948 [Pistacia atlantica]|uniref:Uncharacterized protein n=1 Tax=Pistacia atlantica TaxID=434234 RepID=A0ACC1BP89_9ROSI|nr:hypothetical protein Patl1_03948 [Pistacia atlantica]